MYLENQFINILYNHYNVTSFLNKNPLIFIDYFFNTNSVPFNKLSKTFEVIYNNDELYFISMLKVLNKYIDERNVNTFIKLFTTIYNIELFETVCDHIKYLDLKTLYFYDLLKKYNSCIILDEKTYYFLRDIIDFNKSYLGDYLTILQRQIITGNYNVVKLIVNNHQIVENVSNKHCTIYLLYIMYPQLLSKYVLDLYERLEYIVSLIDRNKNEDEEIDEELEEINISLKEYNFADNVSIISYVTDSKTLYKLINKGCDFSNYYNRLVERSKNKFLLIENGIYMEYFTEEVEKMMYDRYKKKLYDTFIDNDILIKDIVNDILKYI
jgi:hypothetical protein